jgi:hypothetical protein
MFVMPARRILALVVLFAICLTACGGGTGPGYDERSQVTVIDVATADIVRNIELGNHNCGIACSPSGDYVYVASNYSPELTSISVGGLEISDTLGLGDDVTARFCLDDTGDRLFLPVWDALLEIDIPAMVVSDTIAVGTWGCTPQGLHKRPGSDTLFVLGELPVQIVDLSDEAIVGELSVTAYSMAVSADGSMLYCTDGTTISAVSASTGDVLTSITMGRAISDLCLAPGSGYLYASWYAGSLSSPQGGIYQLSTGDLSKVDSVEVSSWVEKICWVPVENLICASCAEGWTERSVAFYDFPQLTLQTAVQRSMQDLCSTPAGSYVFCSIHYSDQAN